MPIEKRGGLVPWPFNSAGLVEQFTDMIVKASPSDLVCINKKATLTIPEKNETFSWKTPDLASVYGKHLKNEKLLLPLSIPDKYKAVVDARQAKLVVERCCVKTELADKGDFSSCVRTTSVEDANFWVFDDSP